eukprot:4371236-Pyramimonas_sp.AAC.1
MARFSRIRLLTPCQVSSLDRCCVSRRTFMSDSARIISLCVIGRTSASFTCCAYFLLTGASGGGSL